MKSSQVAAMTYTVRDFFQTERDVAHSLERIASIGYRAVELFGLDAVAPETVAAMLSNNGLRAVACHVNPADLLNNPEGVAERVSNMGCRYAVFPIPGEVELTDPDDVGKFAGRLNECGAVLAENGVTLAYHNHQHEFRRAGNEPTLEIIYRETKPELVVAELDTYWVQYGGGNPATWCRKLKGRLPLLHVKDFAINSHSQPAFAEAGMGNLDWREIIAAADDAGCQWFIVEQDVCPGDPFESLRISYQFLQGLCDGD